MKLTVNTSNNIFLNVRDGSPSTSATNNNYLASGTVLDIIDVGSGTLFEGSDIWYKCVDGHFYWSGGFLPPPQGFIPGNYIDKKIEFLSDKTQLDYHNNSADESKWKVSW